MQGPYLRIHSNNIAICLKRRQIIDPYCVVHNDSYEHIQKGSLHIWTGIITLRAKLSGAVYCNSVLSVTGGRRAAGGVRTLLQPVRAQCVRLSERFLSLGYF